MFLVKSFLRKSLKLPETEVYLIIFLTFPKISFDQKSECHK